MNPLQKNPATEASIAAEPVRYKDKTMQRMYAGLLVLAAARDGELYYNGQPHRGASHRCAFWDGFNGVPSLYSKSPGTQVHAAYMAGKEFARRQGK